MNLNKIITKSKNMFFDASKKYRTQGLSIVPYESLIAKNGENLFLIHKNMIFDKGTIQDSSYDVWRITDKLELIKEDVSKLGIQFFRTLKTIKEIK